jgi:hypothetical protein
MNDPNFPKNLDIHPLHLTPATNDSTAQEDVWKQQAAIKQYGIAGRIWEASHALIEYFTAQSTTFNPPCSIFEKGRNTIVELGSGQSVASLHLAAQLRKDDTLVLTDLPNVVPLMQQSIDTWSETRTEGTMLPVAEPLGWGTDIEHLEKYGQLSHVICCDLVSPNLR